jgi:amino acid transporter
VTVVQSVSSGADSSPVGKGLKGGVLGLLSSVVVGVASTAPAYSLAATLGFVVATAAGGGIVGVKAPGIILLAFIPMYCIAVAYAELNSREPDCGTTFTWAARAFGPKWGWMGGWGIIAADIIVMSNLAQIAGKYGFLLFGFDGLAASNLWTTVAGVVWIMVMTYICYRGIEVSARLQYVLLGIEIVVLVVFAGCALTKVLSGTAPRGSLSPSLSWLWPSGVPLSGLVPAFLLAVFIYWGWDTAVAINEESDDPVQTPGRAAVLSTLLLLAIYTVVSVATVAFAGTGRTGIGLANQDNADDVFTAIGPVVFGNSTFGKALEALLLISILTSASASTQTTILPTARTALSMGVFGAMPKRFARIHPKYLTPTDSTVWMGIASIVFYVALISVSTSVLADSISAVGLMIAFYYGLTGFVCVWYFRGTLSSSVRNFVMRGLLPFFGGLVLLAAFLEACKQYAAPDYGETTMLGIGGVFVIGIGTLLFGVVLMFLWRRRAPVYFRGETLSKATPEVRAGDGGRSRNGSAGAGSSR